MPLINIQIIYFCQIEWQLYLKLANKACFARVRAARGWTLLYRATFSDPMDLTHTLDATLKASQGSNLLPIRL